MRLWGAAPTFPTAGSFKEVGSPTKADIPSWPRISRLFRKICHNLSAVVVSAGPPHLLSEGTASSFPRCKVNALRPVKAVRGREMALTSELPPPPNSPHPLLFLKNLGSSPFFRSLKGQSTVDYPRSSAGRMLKRPASYPVPLQTKSLGPESDMTYGKVAEQVTSGGGTRTQAFNSEACIFFLWSYLNKTRWRWEPSLILSFVSPTLRLSTGIVITPVCSA